MALIVLAGYVLTFWVEHMFIEMYIIMFAVLTGVPYLLIMFNSDKYRLDR